MSMGLELLLDGARGAYIPRDFAMFIQDMDNVTEEDKQILSAGPDHQWYWETWDDVLGKASSNINGKIWRLYQDGDLWAYCEELMTDEEYEDFFGQERN